MSIRLSSGIHNRQSIFPVGSLRGVCGAHVIKKNIRSAPKRLQDSLWIGKCGEVQLGFSVERKMGRSLRSIFEGWERGRKFM